MQPIDFEDPETTPPTTATDLTSWRSMSEAVSEGELSSTVPTSRPQLRAPELF